MIVRPITLPAGDYKDCLHTRCSDNFYQETEEYLAIGGEHGIVQRTSDRTEDASGSARQDSYRHGAFAYPIHMRRTSRPESVG